MKKKTYRTEEEKKEFERAIEWAGNKSELARRLGVSPQYIWAALHSDRAISARVACQLEAISGGKFKAENLNKMLKTT